MLAGQSENLRKAYQRLEFSFKIEAVAGSCMLYYTSNLHCVDVSLSPNVRTNALRLHVLCSYHIR